MDYEMFLMSRMHEEWLRIGDASRAVRNGVATTGRVITAAAAIMELAGARAWWLPSWLDRRIPRLALERGTM